MSILEVLFLNDVRNYTFESEFGVLYSVRFLYFKYNYKYRREYSTEIIGLGEVREGHVARARSASAT